MLEYNNLYLPFSTNALGLSCLQRLTGATEMRRAAFLRQSTGFTGFKLKPYTIAYVFYVGAHLHRMQEILRGASEELDCSITTLNVNLPEAPRGYRCGDRRGSRRVF